MARRSYDYIIVGAGSAGCVLAHRLTEDPDTHVLLLEAGGKDTHPLLRVPIGIGELHERRMFDWRYNTVPESGLAGRELVTLRGKVLGGSSSVNMMAFTRGSPADYDRWARNGATGWSWNDVLPYFKRVESWEGGETAQRGGSGLVAVEYSRSSDPLEDAFMAAAAAIGYPLTADYNAEALGFGRTQFSIRKGRRESASSAYLRGVTRRPNLTVLTNAPAHRVLIDATKAEGVEYSRGGVLMRAHVTREVILSAGSLNTPQLLMLSGIGPADHLRAFGISPIAALAVGDNLQDHLKGLLLFKRRPPVGPFQKALRYDNLAVALAQALFLGSGPATALPLGVQGYIKSGSHLAVPDLEFMLASASMSARPWLPRVSPRFVDAFGISPVNLHPESRGTVRLSSPDPRAPVRIEFNYLSAQADIAKLRQGFRLSRELGYHSKLDAFRDVELRPGSEVASDNEIDRYLRTSATSVSHPVGTCRMGADEAAVIDPELRVRGIDGLRVVDASAFPDLVSAHTNAAVFMLAEKAADLLRGRTPKM